MSCRDGPARLTRIESALKTASFDTVRQEFAERFELGVSEVEGAASTDLLSFKEAAPDKDYNNPDRLIELAQLLYVIKAFGTTALSITQLIRSAPGEPEAQLAPPCSRQASTAIARGATAPYLE